jgi:hypothetical protein
VALSNAAVLKNLNGRVAVTICPQRVHYLNLSLNQFLKENAYIHRLGYHYHSTCLLFAVIITLTASKK